MTEDGKLTNRQLLAISQIIASPTLEGARRKARISKGTLYAWLKNEAFKAELERQRDEVIGLTLDRLKSATTKAADGLIGLMDTSQENLKRQVCKDIIDYTMKSMEFEKVERRLSEIEQELSKRRNFK